MADQSTWSQQQGWGQPQWPGQAAGQFPPQGGQFPPDQGAVTPPPPAPKEPTPLDPPAVYYNQIWRVPPLVVDTQEAADALDPNEWTTGAPPAAGGTQAAAKPQWPQVYYNVNVSPKIVSSAAEARALGEDWKQFDISDGVAKAAEANNAAKAALAAAKAQQSQSQG